MNTKTCVIGFFLLGLFLISHAEDKNSQGFTIPSTPAIDKKYDLSYLQRVSLMDYKIEKNLSEEIRNREIKYTMHWMKKAIHYKLLPEDISNKIQFVSDLWGKDEGTVINYESGGYKFKVINSRVLILLVEGDGIKDHDILWCFDKFTNYKLAFRDVELTMVEQKTLEDSILYGIANIDIKWATNWFKKPVEWYKNDKTVMFIFQKDLKPPVSKIRIDPFLIKDGFSLSSPDAYKCFERDFKKAIEEAAAIAGKSRIDDSVIKGRPILRSPKN